MELIVDGQGIIFYRIPRGTTLFRGDSDEYLYKEQIMRLQNQPTFFGVEQENVEENYGIAYEFVTLVELNLIALDKNQGTAFYNLLPAEYKRILDTNYGYKTGTRDSVSEEDKKILAYICENGYDGYACGTMPTTMGGTFHSEVALCSPADKLSGGECVTDPATAKHKIYELKMRRFAPVKQKRQPLRNMESPPRQLFSGLDSPKPLARGLFDSPRSPPVARGLFDSPRSPSVARGLFSTDDKENTSLFGGKRRTKTKKFTFRKSGAKGKIERKKRRTQKKRRNKKTKK